MFQFHLSSRNLCLLSTLSALLICTTAPTLASPSTPAPTAVKRAVNLPPSAELHYAVKAQYRGLTLKGSTLTRWTADNRRYDVVVETRANLLGRLLESHSEGRVNDYGLVPLRLTEQRMRKPPHTVTFDQEGRTLRFSASPTTYPLKGGEQDRTSVVWQLASLARASPNRVKPGTEWTFLVAGRKDAEVWTFRVIKRELVRTPKGQFAALHIAKLPSQSREQQKLDIWLAPGMEWYPVRIVFKDANGTDLDQVLEQITKR